MFDRLYHADWSVHAAKRWVAMARRTAAGWAVTAPCPVGDPATLRATLLGHSAPVLVGLDLPLGLPAAYAHRAGITAFPDWLAALGHPPWHETLNVCRAADEIALWRPFYPHAPGGTTRAQLIGALGLDGPGDLLRICERGGAARQQACPLFWTLGANQVGKAAITGWVEVIIPLIRAGARLWPYQGRLPDLACAAGPVLCETYPADAPRVIGVMPGKGFSKRRPSDRAALAPALRRHADRWGIEMDNATRGALRAGFGPRAEGEDPFDALIGLLAMIEIVEGRHPEAPDRLPDETGVEGWILGRG